MYWSKLFIPTLREDPAQSESPAHALLIRAGYMRLLGHGNYHYLFAAQRSMLKIQTIARQEMESLGAQELTIAQVKPITHALEDIAREIQSYRDFPQVWYQIEQRPWLEPGLGDFLVQHSFSLDLSREGLHESIEKHRHTYARILERCGIEYIDTGSDLMLRSDTGRDFVALGERYAAHLEFAAGIATPPLAPDPEGNFSPEEFHTPNIGSIADLAAFTKLPETSLIKSLVRTAQGKPVMILVRGDHQLSEAKLSQVLDTSLIGAPSPQNVRQWLGADAGSLGPVRVKDMPILIDEALRGRRNMIAGANKNDYHLRYVTPGEDFECRFADLREVAAGDTAPDGTPLRIEKAIRLAALRTLPGTYGDPARPLWLGHSRLWLEQILIAAAGSNRDQGSSNRDKDGLTLKPAIAPFTLVIVPIDYNTPELRSAAEELYNSARAAGIDVILDDRDVRAGVKFKDADLVGIPYRINVGKKLAQGLVEFVTRSPKQSVDVPLAEALRSLPSASPLS